MTEFQPLSSKTGKTCGMPSYGDLRNRVRADGSQWLQPELLEFFNQRAEAGSITLTQAGEEFFDGMNVVAVFSRLPRKCLGRLRRTVQGK